MEYIIKLPDTLLNDYFYIGAYPLRSLNFERDTILISVGVGAYEGTDLTYKFDPKIKDWRLMEVKFWVENLVGEKRYESLEFKPQTLSDFNYRDYL